MSGHELSHGVIQNTTNLAYRNQSGTTEAFADIFGSMIHRDDWKLAEDIANGTGKDSDNKIPTVNGDELILSLDIRDSDPNTLYISETQPEDYYPLTTTKLSKKPSVTDDGTLALYVTEDFTVNVVNLDPFKPEETVVSADGVWGGVSVSKDETKLATIFRDDFNIVYIADLVTGES